MREMSTQGLGEMTMRFLKGLEEEFGDNVTFENAIVAVAYRTEVDGGEQSGVAFRAAMGARFGNVGLLTETIRLVQS